MAVKFRAVNFWRDCCTLLVGLALAAANSYGADEKPSPTLPDAAAAAVKAAYPNFNPGPVVLTKDLGFTVYMVQLAEYGGPRKVIVAAEVTPDGILVKAPNLKVDGLAMSDAATKAVAAADEGAKVTYVNDYVLMAQVKKIDDPKLTKLATPIPMYDVTVAKDDKTGFMQVDADGKVITPFAWLTKAAAVVPAGKLVIRVNCGAVVDYTDMSGVLWSADQKYEKGKTTWGWNDDQNTHTTQHTGLFILGTDAPGVYDVERSKAGRYRFDVPNGNYTVRLHYCENWTGASKPNVRPFAVKLQGIVVIPRVDAAADPGFHKPMMKEIKDVVVSNGTLLTDQTPLLQNDTHPFVDAIEVIQQ